jgi:hypothetical protein
MLVRFSHKLCIAIVVIGAFEFWVCFRFPTSPMASLFWITDILLGLLLMIYAYKIGYHRGCNRGLEMGVNTGIEKTIAQFGELLTRNAVPSSSRD